MGFWTISLADNDKIPSLLLKNKILLAFFILHKILLKSWVTEENIKSILDWNYYISETLDIFRVIYRWGSKSLYYTCIFSKTKSQFIYYTCMKQNPKWDDWFEQSLELILIFLMLVQFPSVHYLPEAVSQIPSACCLVSAVSLGFLSVSYW